jgi:hypothetical protein
MATRNFSIAVATTLVTTALSVACSSGGSSSSIGTTDASDSAASGGDSIASDSDQSDSSTIGGDSTSTGDGAPCSSKLSGMFSLTFTRDADAGTCPPGDLPNQSFEILCLNGKCGFGIGDGCVAQIDGCRLFATGCMTSPPDVPATIDVDVVITDTGLSGVWDVTATPSPSGGMCSANLHVVGTRN